MYVSGELHALATSSPGIRPRYSLDMRLGGFKFRDGHSTEENNIAMYGFAPGHPPRSSPIYRSRSLHRRIWFVRKLLKIRCAWLRSNASNKWQEQWLQLQASDTDLLTSPAVPGSNLRLLFSYRTYTVSKLHSLCSTEGDYELRIAKACILIQFSSFLLL
jgi:hypothetical protein